MIQTCIFPLSSLKIASQQRLPYFIHEKQTKWMTNWHTDQAIKKSHMSERFAIAGLRFDILVKLRGLQNPWSTSQVRVYRASLLGNFQDSG